MRLVALALAAHLLGCATLPPCPARGGNQWIEVRGARITLDTDVSDARATRLVTAYEQALADVTALAPLVLGLDVPPHGPLRAVVFRRADHAQEIRNDPWAGVYRPDWPPRISLADLDDAQLVQHEIAHFVVHQTIGPVPSWLDEGMAEYLATVRVAGDKTRLGDIPQLISKFGGRGDARIDGQPLPTLRQLLDAPQSQFRERSGPMYVAAWVLVHLLNNERPEHRELFRDYLGQLAQGIDARFAWYYTLRTVERELQAQYDEYIRRLIVRGVFETRTWIVDRVPPRLAVTPSAPRVLADGEVHALWADIRELPSQRLIDELRLAERHAADSAPLHLWLAREADRDKDFAAAERELEAAERLAPADPSVLYLRFRKNFAHAIENRSAVVGVQVSHLADGARRLVRVTADPAALHLLAVFYDLVGERDLAASLAAREVDLYADCAACWYDVAMFQIRQGNLDGAADAVSRCFGHAAGREPMTSIAARLRATVLELRKHQSDAP